MSRPFFFAKLSLNSVDRGYRLPEPYETLDTELRVLVSLPSSYPTNAPPQLQLLSRYIGAFSVDSDLFGAILRTYISQDGVEWIPDTVCIFDGIEWVKERCLKWYEERLSDEKAHEILREDDVKKQEDVDLETPDSQRRAELLRPEYVELPKGVEIFVSEPVVDRKSVFIGRACRITDPSQVI